LPINFACINQTIGFNHDATDADGDSLVYELYNPYDAHYGGAPMTNPDNFQPVKWESGYSMLNPLGATSGLIFQRRTGSITFTPKMAGQFLVGIKVLEFRKGKLIGETKRDFHVTVNSCVPGVIANFIAPLKVCTSNEVIYRNTGSGGTLFFWDFGDTTIRSDTSVLKSPRYTFSKPGKYKTSLITKIKTPPCSDTFVFELQVIQNFKASLPADTLYCGNFLEQLNASPAGKQYTWNTGEKTSLITISKGGLYWVRISDSICYAFDSIRILNDVSKLNLGRDSTICSDSFTPFVFNAPPAYTTYLWNDGTNKQSVHIPKAGAYSVSVINANNCPSSDTILFTRYPAPNLEINDTLFCRNTFVLLDGHDRHPLSGGDTRYLWNTGDTTPWLMTTIAGRYILTAKNKMCSVRDTADLTYIQTGLDLGNDTFYCGPFSRVLMPRQDYVTYLWHDLSQSKNHTATTPGKKKLTITTKEGCAESDSVWISEFPPPDVGLGHDTSICLTSVFELSAIDSAISYLWNTGARTRSIFISDSGLYRVTVIMKNGCEATDSMLVHKRGDVLPVEVFMPNAFSPNHDQINEFYPGHMIAQSPEGFDMKIYNRWGEKIFESHDPNIQWDGKVDNRLAPQDEYIFLINHMGCDNMQRQFRGTFTLLR
jgi:gliding motility-associated-like protein